MRFRRHSRDERLWGMLVTAVVKHMAGQVSNLQITPNSDVVKYEITREGGKLQISTREGSSTTMAAKFDQHCRARTKSGKRPLRLHFWVYRRK